MPALGISKQLYDLSNIYADVTRKLNKALLAISRRQSDPVRAANRPIDKPLNDSERALEGALNTFCGRFDLLCEALLVHMQVIGNGSNDFTSVHMLVNAISTDITNDEPTSKARRIR
jgi:hypothetical protein